MKYSTETHVYEEKIDLNAQILSREEIISPTYHWIS